MREPEMELILNKYYELLENDNNEYKIKKISLNGPIHMNEKWKELICKFTKFSHESNILFICITLEVSKLFKSKLSKFLQF